MKKHFLVFILISLSSFISSCAIQTNIIKSLQDIKKSILKIETWARLGACDETTGICTEPELISMGSGSVVLYKNKKAVLTAAHVCRQESFEKFVNMHNGHFFLKAIDRDNKEYIIKVLKYDHSQDICLLASISGDLPSYLKISSKKPEYAEITYNLAAPLGIIDQQMVPTYQGFFFGDSEGRAFYSIAVAGGSSGSPIVNIKGELVGMIHSVHYKFHHISLSATHQQLWNFLKIEQNYTLEFRNSSQR
jgi:S1-C subfamily serine protease